MTKKIILTLFLFISLFGGVNNIFASLYDGAEIKNVINNDNSFDGVTAIPDNNLNIPGFGKYDPLAQPTETKVGEGTILDTQESLNQREKSAKVEADKVASKKAAADRKKECEGSKKCFNQSSFEINVNDTFGIGFSANKEYDNLSDSKQKINFVLGTIIQKLMIALGVLSVLIMTVGGGYIIMFHGQDELLSKGKSIFMSGVIALVVALSSYYLVSGLRFILYNQ